MRLHEPRRSRLQMKLEVLERVTNRSDLGKTNIMFACNLSWKAVTEILNYMTLSGLITHHEDGTYRITSKGIETYNQVRASLNFINSDSPPHDHF